MRKTNIFLKTFQRNFNKPLGKHTKPLSVRRGCSSGVSLETTKNIFIRLKKMGQNNFFKRNKKIQRRKYEVKPSKKTKSRNNSNTKNNVKNCAQQKKTIQDGTTQPTTDKQTNE